MFNGLSKERADQYLKPFAPALLEFVEAIYADKDGQDDGEQLALSWHPELGSGLALSWLPGAVSWEGAEACESRLVALAGGLPAVSLTHRPLMLCLPNNLQVCGRRRRRCWATSPPPSPLWACSSSRSHSCSPSCSSWGRTLPPRTRPTGPHR
jgi:hypothetical protein